jgi:hypothetical protein
LRVSTWRRSTDVEDVVRVSVQNLSPPWQAWLGLAQWGVKLRGKPKGIVRLAGLGCLGAG